MAVQLAAQAGLSRQAIVLRQRLELYRRGMPYIEQYPTDSESEDGSETASD